MNVKAGASKSELVREVNFYLYRVTCFRDEDLIKKVCEGFEGRGVDFSWIVRSELYSRE